MSCLFSINKKGNTIINPDALKLAPEFAYLTEEEMLCVILAFDYDSIFRQFPEDERKRRARARIFGMKNEKFFDLAKTQKAVELYKMLQYNPIRNQIIVLRRKMDSINDKIDKLDDDDNKGFKELLTMSKEAKVVIKNLEDDLNKEEEQELQDVEGKSKLSWLEKRQANAEQYKAMKNRTGK